MKIVPEKEMLMILVPSDKKDAILQAITALPCFAEAGSGIIFCNEAQDFTLLGKK
jgi:nitrogen regulatory protein PII